jgi:hypothetical protein
VTRLYAGRRAAAQLTSFEESEESHMDIGMDRIGPAGDIEARAYLRGAPRQGPGQQQTGTPLLLVETRRLRAAARAPFLCPAMPPMHTAKKQLRPIMTRILCLVAWVEHGPASTGPGLHTVSLAGRPKSAAQITRNTYS